MYINSETLEEYKDIDDIRKHFPNTCFPLNLTDEILSSFNIFPIKETKPEYNPIIEVAIKAGVTLLYDDWVRQWEINKKYDNVEAEKIAIANYIVTLKQSKIEEINAARLDANTSYFEYLGKKISCDQLSRSDIDATNGYISTNNKMPPNWVGFWKTADNEYIPINTVEEWNALYTSMYMTGSNNFIKAQQLKAQLNSIVEPTLESIEAINAISW